MAYHQIYIDRFRNVPIFTSKATNSWQFGWQMEQDVSKADKEKIVQAIEKLEVNKDRCFTIHVIHNRSTVDQPTDCQGGKKSLGIQIASMMQAVPEEQLQQSVHATVQVGEWLGEVLRWMMYCTYRYIMDIRMAMSCLDIRKMFFVKTTAPQQGFPCEGLYVCFHPSWLFVWNLNARACTYRYHVIPCILHTHAYTEYSTNTDGNETYINLGATTGYSSLMPFGIYWYGLVSAPAI